MRNIAICAAVAGLAMAACATTPTPEQLAAIVAAQTPEHFQSTAVIENDSLDTVAKVSTEPGFQEARGLLGIVWNDNFLRGFVDKRTGATTIQVYQRIMYDGDWRFYNVVNYETPNGPESKPLTVISRDVLSCSAYSGCTHSEHVAFDIEEALLREIAARYEPGAMAAWQFKLGAQRAEDWRDGMLPAEIVGFLAALDQLRAQLGVPSPSSSLKSPDQGG